MTVVVTRWACAGRVATTCAARGVLSRFRDAAAMARGGAGHDRLAETIDLLTVVPLTDMPEVRPGDDLAALLHRSLAAVGAVAGDIVVVTQKIVSKAEGRFVALRDVRPGDEARALAATTRKDARLVELILRESVAVVRAVPGVLIVRHRSGHVMANAGIDRSNLGGADEDTVLLLPEDSDTSAAQLRERLTALLGFAPGVVISDSFGRPWRHGVTCVALGAAGVPALHDRRGQLDRDGRTLEVTQIAVADLVASAAGLVTGEGAEGIPAALVRGVDLAGAPHRPAAAILRPPEEDLFR